MRSVRKTNKPRRSPLARWRDVRSDGSVGEPVGFAELAAATLITDTLSVTSIRVNFFTRTVGSAFAPEVQILSPRPFNTCI